MRKRLLGLVGVAALGAAAGVLMLAQGPDGSRTAGSAGDGGRTAWGDPNLEGIWTDVYETPLERPSQFANKEFFTDEERQELDKLRSSLPGRNLRVERGSQQDVAGAYNQEWISVRPTGKRTSLIVDPPDGRLPPLTPEAAKKVQMDREYRLALLQPTATCKEGDNRGACSGGKYGPVSPRRNEQPPFYNTARMNRLDGPEDGSLDNRCMNKGFPNLGDSYSRIVQAPGVVTIYDTIGDGHGYPRVIPVDGSAHLPASIYQRFGDSRGRWEGDTLVVDVTNFSPKHSFQLGHVARENLHVVERYTRVNDMTLEWSVTFDDPTTWTRPWTVKRELTRQDDTANRIYYEPRCTEGNYGFPTQLLGERLAEQRFAEGKGPDPATLDIATDFGSPGGTDPLRRR